MKFDKDITKIKRVTFFLRHSVVVILVILAVVVVVVVVAADNVKCQKLQHCSRFFSHTFPHKLRRTRVVCQAPRSASATELRQQLHSLLARQRINYKLSVITYRTRSTGNPAYLHHLIHDYLPARTLRSSDKLLLTVPRMVLALSAKAFSISAPSVWNSLSYSCRSAELLSTRV